MRNILMNFVKLKRKISADDIMPWASLLTIYLMLSMFPLIIILTEVISRTSLANPQLLNYWTDLLPTDVYVTLKSVAEGLVVEQNTTIIPTATIITLWSSSRAMLAIIKALNKAYGIREKRNYFQLRITH